MPRTLFQTRETFFAAFLFLFSANLAAAQTPQTPLMLSSGQQRQIHDLSARILKYADRAGCKKNSCTILVVNFAGPSGSTSTLGMQLADEVSTQLTSQANGVQVTSRRELQQYLDKERIASKLLEDDNAARWLAKEMGATAVLVGYLRGGPAQKNLHVQLLDTRDFAKKDAKIKSHVEEETINDLGYPGDLDPAEPFGAPPELGGPNPLPRAGQRAAGHPTTMPRCTYRPDPPYSEAARVVKFQGTIVMQVVISREGDIPHAQIVKGLPFGLNKQSLEVVSRWRCQPSTVDAQPITTQVAIEISYRLY
jgi:TonB family protein